MYFNPPGSSAHLVPPPAGPIRVPARPPVPPPTIIDAVNSTFIDVRYCKLSGTYHVTTSEQSRPAEHTTQHAHCTESESQLTSTMLPCAETIMTKQTNKPHAQMQTHLLPRMNDSAPRDYNSPFASEVLWKYLSLSFGSGMICNGQQVKIRGWQEGSPKTSAPVHFHAAGPRDTTGPHTADSHIIGGKKSWSLLQWRNNINEVSDLTNWFESPHEKLMMRSYMGFDLNSKNEHLLETTVGSGTSCAAMTAINWTVHLLCWNYQLSILRICCFCVREV